MNIEKLKLMQEAVRQAVDEKFVAGANLLVIKDGEEQFYCEEGMADVQNGTPVRRGTIFRLYSQTKPITAAAAMILMERGQIELMDPVSKYLEGFKDQKVWTPEGPEPVRRPMEIRDLLSMTSGLPYGGGPSVPEQQAQAVFDEANTKLHTDQEIGTVEMANRLGRNLLMFHPGEKFMYGTSADVLGAVIEVVSGMRFGEFLRKEIFEPLHMIDTDFWVPGSKQYRLAKVYVNGRVPEEYDHDHLTIQHGMDQPPRYEAGGAGLASTIDDYRRFAMMLMNGGVYKGVRVLSPKTVEYMTTHHLTPQQQPYLEQTWPNLAGYSYGNLMRVLTDPGEAVYEGFEGEYGWDGWLGTYFFNAPKEKLIMILMYQLSDAGTTRLTRVLRNLLGAAMS